MAQLISSAAVPTPTATPSLDRDPCWAVHDGAAGNRRQALALAQALALPAREWSLCASVPARWFAPREFPGSSSAFGEEFTRALRDHPPSLAIGCGRQAALATRQARAAGARAVQILDPRIATTHWDLVIAPEHDGVRVLKAALGQGGRGQEALKAAFLGGLDVRRFELREPTLHDAFISLTGDNPDIDQSVKTGAEVAR